MKKSQLYLLMLLLPLAISGCFGFSKDKPILDPKYTVYKNKTLGEAAYQVRYLDKWELTEEATADLGTSTDLAIFKVNRDQKITVKVYQEAEESVILELFNIESQSQTEVNRLLGERVIGTAKDNNEPVEAILIKNGEYLYVLKTNQPHSAEFIDFLNNITIFNNLNTVEVLPDEIKRPIYKLYFGRTGISPDNCGVSYYREVYFNKPDDEIELIPKIIQTLLSPDQLRLEDLGLFTAIPEGTRLLSFGYDNNKAIVNFSAHLNLGGGSCSMAMRRSQIERTLMSLNEISNLQIKEVEIWVDGSADEVLQP